MFLSNRDLVEIVDWRRKLHSRPEISGEESETAAEVQKFLSQTEPDRIVSGLGGTGVAVVYDGGAPGPTVMFRAELDALPIEELTDIPHRSEVDGKAHLCGHDGHMAILAALGRGFGRARPERGRAVLMFQPAEENGAGAAAVMADSHFAEIRPDFVFSLHNVPGVAFGEVELREGLANCASRGMRVVLTGKTAHAAAPETGISPMNAVAGLMPALTALRAGSFPSHDFAMATVTHASMGEPAFGIAPGKAEIWITLRTASDARMDELCERAEGLVRDAADAAGLTHATSYHDVFVHCENDAEAVKHLRLALDAEGVRHSPGEPLKASEDFGRFGSAGKSAMFFLGAGEKHPSLHNPDYDFPDDLIPIGAKIFMRTARDLLG
jgi:amidohydrolase